jgi:hypothetical protein
MGKSFAPSPTARVAAGCSRSTPRELPKLRELAVWAADRPEQMTGQALQPVRLRQVEADGVAHRSTNGTKLPETRAVRAPPERMVRTSVRAPGMSRTRLRKTSSKTLTGKPSRRATRARSAATKSIARRVMALTSGFTPR